VADELVIIVPRSWLLFPSRFSEVEGLPSLVCQICARSTGMTSLSGIFKGQFKLVLRACCPGSHSEDLMKFVTQYCSENVREARRRNNPMILVKCDNTTGRIILQGMLFQQSKLLPDGSLVVCYCSR